MVISHKYKIILLPFTVMGVLISLKFWYITVPLICTGLIIGYHISDVKNKLTEGE